MKPCEHVEPQNGCRVCWLAANDPRYSRLWGDPSTIVASPCRHQGAATGQTVQCSTCSGKVALKVFACSVHGTCTQGKQVQGFACCKGCTEFAPAREAVPPRWSYGVTTVPSRRGTLLPRTLASLAAGGFDRPHLFVDGEADGASWRNQFGLDVTCRWPKVKVAGNWVLSLYEMYYREPSADRYALFQDDFVTYRNLRQYLERSHYPEKGYWNLYTFPSNQKLSPGRVGWYAANQFGRGAVALVFSRDAVVELLCTRHLVERVQNWSKSPRSLEGWRRGDCSIDGGIVDSFRSIGWREYVHDPSLVQHTGLASTHSTSKHPLAPSWRGEGFDALELLASDPVQLTSAQTNTRRVAE